MTFSPRIIAGPEINQAINEIYSAYGDEVTIAGKAKSLLKFGKNIDLDAGVWETIWELGGDETYPTTNTIDRIVSSNAADTQTISLEGHTVTGAGADAEFTFVVQTVTLNGQTPVALTTPLARASRAATTSGTALAGDVYVFEDSATTGGVPNDLTKAHIKIAGSLGDNQSFKAATTFSNRDYFIMTGFTCSVSRTTSASVDFEIQVRQVGGLFLPKQRIDVNSVAQGTTQIKFNPYIIIPKNADVRVRGVSSANNTEVNASFQGYLAEVS